ncbi:MAG TPA: hypothetical protein VFG84_02505 [Gemmatimonadaceae bacterium]|nr:hypothetical protein [Gemmatimonadaceae bacterium]
MIWSRISRTASFAVFVCSSAVSTSVPAQAGTRERSVTPIVRIPSEGAGYRFTVIAAIERLPDGRFAALEAADRRILVFDSTGKHVKSLGGSGDGPGEFRWPQSMGLQGDSLWIGDATHRRITTFTPELSFARTQTIVSGGIPSRTARGGVVALSLIMLSPTQAQSRMVVAITGSSVDTVISVNYPAEALLIETGAGAILAPQPFSDAPLLHVTHDGRAAIAIMRETTGRGRTAVRVRKVGLDGTRGFDVSLSHEPAAVPKGLVDIEIARLGDILQRRMPNERRDEIDRRVRAALDIPDFAPAVTAVSSGKDGYTWLRRVSDGRSPVEWTVLDQEGEVAYRVSLPHDATVLWSRADMLAVTRKDDDGVPRIVVYRMS